MIVLYFVWSCRYDVSFVSFFFNDPATTEIYTLSLHDALPILSMSWSRSRARVPVTAGSPCCPPGDPVLAGDASPDRKSTRLNSSHVRISYAVFCLKKKKSNQSKCIWCSSLTSHYDCLLYHHMI